MSEEVLNSMSLKTAREYTVQETAWYGIEINTITSAQYAEAITITVDGKFVGHVVFGGVPYETKIFMLPIKQGSVIRSSNTNQLYSISIYKYPMMKL